MGTADYLHYCDYYIIYQIQAMLSRWVKHNLLSLKAAAQGHYVVSFIQFPAQHDFEFVEHRGTFVCPALERWWGAKVGAKVGSLRAHNDLKASSRLIQGLRKL